MNMENQKFNSYLKSINKYQKVSYKIKNINYNNNITNKTTSSNDLNIFFQNISSINNKINNLHILINEMEKHFNVIAFCETKKINNNILNMISNNHNIEYVNPKLNKCGGLTILVNKTINYSITNEFKLNEPTVDEIWIEYIEGKKITLLAFLYRHPLNNKNQIKQFKIKLEASLVNVENKNKYEEIIVMGDINIDLYNIENTEVQDYVNLLSQNNLMIISKNITRPNNNNCGTLIDHIYI